MRTAASQSNERSGISFPVQDPPGSVSTYLLSPTSPAPDLCESGRFDCALTFSTKPPGAAHPIHPAVRNLPWPFADGWRMLTRSPAGSLAPPLLPGTAGPGRHPAPPPSFSQLWKLSPKAREETSLPVRRLGTLSVRVLSPPSLALPARPPVSSRGELCKTRHRGGFQDAENKWQVTSLLPELWPCGPPGSSEPGQARSHLRTFAPAAPATWNALPTPNPIWLASFYPTEPC